MFKKRTFTLAGFFKSLLLNTIYMPRLLLAIARPSTSAALREQVMLACTSVNDCRYCAWLHTRLALKNAVDVDELNAFLENSDGITLPKETAIAILYAQHFAEQQTHVTADARARLKSVFTLWQRLEIQSYLQAIYLGNLTGNTFDALLNRLRGEKIMDSYLLTEVIVSIIGAPILLMLMWKARNDTEVRLTSLSDDTKLPERNGS